MTTENMYPVDSTYHACCNAIGQHARNCKTCVPLPPGAIADIWEGDSDSPYRIVSTPNYAVTDHELLAWADAEQRIDGSLGNARVRIDIEWSGAGLNSDQCRELSSHLLELAVVLDKWTGAR